MRWDFDAPHRRLPPALMFAPMEVGRSGGRRPICLFWMMRRLQLGRQAVRLRDGPKKGRWELPSGGVRRGAHFVGGPERPASWIGDASLARVRRRSALARSTVRASRDVQRHGRACEHSPRSQKRKTKRLAYSLGRLAARGWITVDEITRKLTLCCESNGLARDDGLTRSALRFSAGSAQG